MYKGTFDKESYNKSLGYMCRLYSRQEKSIKPKSYKKVMSINFIKGNYKRINNHIVNGYSFRSKINKEEIDDNITMFLVRYDLVNKIPYVKTEERFIRYLRIIGSKSVKEMKRYAKGDKVMEEIIKMLREWNIESDRINYQRRIDDAKEEGREEGKEEGKEEAFNIVVKKLLEKNASKEYILEITGISEEEYKKIKKAK